MSDRNGLLTISHVICALCTRPRLFGRPVPRITTTLDPVLSATRNSLIDQFGNRPAKVQIIGGLATRRTSHVHQLQLGKLRLRPRRRQFCPRRRLFNPIINFIGFSKTTRTNLRVTRRRQLLLSPDSRTSPSLSVIRFRQTGTDLRLALSDQLRQITRGTLRRIIGDHGTGNNAIVIVSISAKKLLTLTTSPACSPGRCCHTGVRTFHG